MACAAVLMDVTGDPSALARIGLVSLGVDGPKSLVVYRCMNLPLRDVILSPTVSKHLTHLPT
jgi:hypothetical protein